MMMCCAAHHLGLRKGGDYVGAASVCRSAQADPGWSITYDYEYMHDYDSALVQLMILMLMLSLSVTMKEKNMMIVDPAHDLHYRHHHHRLHLLPVQMSVVTCSLPNTTAMLWSAAS